jgi:hypothetical protein
MISLPVIVDKKINSLLLNIKQRQTWKCKILSLRAEGKKAANGHDIFNLWGQ